MTKPFETTTYLATALDPIHVGTGGYRLGRVDNTIVREPGTLLPKIPGSSIAGVTRALTALSIQSADPSKKKYLEEVEFPDKDGKKSIKLRSCAGKGGGDGQEQCGSNSCEVCTTFGFSKKDQSFQGLAQFSDARLLFFPVATMAGPMWVTSPETLSAAGIHIDGAKAEDWLSLDLKEGQDFVCQSNSTYCGEYINLGWLYLKKVSDGQLTIQGEVKLALSTPRQWKLPGGNKVLANIVSEEILSRIIIVSDFMYSSLVNDNLEVRTSVAIDPATGAAEDTALYTYEAIPRGAVLYFVVTVNDPIHYRIQVDGKPNKILNSKETPADIAWVKDQLIQGLRGFEWFGVGGMNTRGMGRLRVHLG